MSYPNTFRMNDFNVDNLEVPTENFKNHLNFDNLKNVRNFQNANFQENNPNIKYLMSLDSNLNPEPIISSYSNTDSERTDLSDKTVENDFFESKPRQNLWSNTNADLLSADNTGFFQTLPTVNGLHFNTSRDSGDISNDTSVKGSSSSICGGISGPKLFSGSVVTPQTRHARRLYVGGLSPNNCDEDALKNFLNKVICNCIGDEIDSSYILSIYINRQKCFAFVELNSIELTTACLELDGILFLNSQLKILRANEYKPELLPTPCFPPIKLNLSGINFGNSTSHSNHNSQATSYDNSYQIDELIKYCTVSTVQRGSIAIVGFPYDELSKKNELSITVASAVSGNVSAQSKLSKGYGCASRSIRAALRKFQSGSIMNAEYGIDLSQLKIVDVGDIQNGMSIQEAHTSLAEVVVEILQRGATPLVIGGHSNLSSVLASGLMLVSPNPIGVVNVSASVDAGVLEDARFYLQRPNYGSKPNCNGRFLQFATQGSASNYDHSRIVVERGGQILWYNKDLRSRSYINEMARLSPQGLPESLFANTYISKAFKVSLLSLGAGVETNTSRTALSLSSRPICVSFSMGALNSSSFPGHSQLRSTGLTTEDAVDIAMLLGEDKNVAILSINDFNVDVEDNCSSRVIVDIIYSFFVGYSVRGAHRLTSNQSSTVSTQPPSPVADASRQHPLTQQSVVQQGLTQQQVLSQQLIHQALGQNLTPLSSASNNSRFTFQIPSATNSNNSTSPPFPSNSNNQDPNLPIFTQQSFKLPYNY